MLSNDCTRLDRLGLFYYYLLFLAVSKVRNVIPY